MLGRDARRRRQLMAFVSVVIVALQVAVSGAAAEEISLFTTLASPFAMVNPDTGALEGFEVDLWTTAIWPDLALAYPDLNYTWKVVDRAQVLPAVQNASLNVGLGTISVTLARGLLVDFSYEYFHSGLDATVLVDTPKPSVWQFFTPFTPEVWIVIVVLLFVSGHIIWFLERDYQPSLFPRPYFKGVVEGIWYCWGVLTATAQRNLKGFPSRMYSVGWSTFGILIIAAYTANFASMLALETRDIGIRSLDEISGRPLGTVEGSTGEAFIDQYTQGGPVVLYPNILAALEGLLADEVDIVIYDAPVLLYYMAILDTESNMRILGTLLTSEDYAVALNKDSFLRTAVNTALLRAKDAGILDSIYNKWFNRAAVSSVTIVRSSTALTFTTAAGLYILLAVFLAIGIVGFILVRIIAAL